MPILLTLAAATPGLGAQQDTSQPPAPVVRVRPHPPAQTTPNTPRTAATTSSTAATTSSPAGTGTPVVHRPRPVPSSALDLLAPAVSSRPSGTGTAPQATAHPATAPNTPRPRPPATSQATPQSTTQLTPRSTLQPPAGTAPSTAAKVTATPSAPAEHKPANTVNGLNRNVVVIDPGHGGPDAGARIGDNLAEKDVTLALALRLRSLLLARGFTVVLTRDSDAATMQTSANAAPTPLTLDDRAGIANHAHAAACLLLHATGRGTGLHMYSSELTPVPAEPVQIPWLTGQAAWIPASRALEGQLGTALGRSHIPLLASSASIRPVDSLTCPALVLELAPETPGAPATVLDAGYEERVAAALAGALVFWENTVQPPPRIPAPPRHHAETPTSAPAADVPEAQP